MSQLNNYKSLVRNESWKETVKNIPEKYFDWVVDDIPYGIGVGQMSFLTETKTLVKQKNGTKLNPRKTSKGYVKKDWDKEAPSQDYFDEMRRISNNQIIFGVEYVNWEGLGNGRIKWNKGVPEDVSFKGYEMAYCSSINHVHEINLLWSGMQQAENLQNPMRQQGNKRKNEKRIHPCHKPILLYKKIAIDFDLKGKKVYCGHNGSGSDRIAFHNYVLEFLASEIDKEYFDLQESRFLNHQNISQLKMFY
jgi:site-specific DNA-methyltransferase (adenine-specific)